MADEPNRDELRNKARADRLNKAKPDELFVLVKDPKTNAPKRVSADVADWYDPWDAKAGTEPAKAPPAPTAKAGKKTTVVSDTERDPSDSTTEIGSGSKK